MKAGIFLRWLLPCDVCCNNAQSSGMAVLLIKLVNINYHSISFFINHWISTMDKVE